MPLLYLYMPENIENKLLPEVANRLSKRFEKKVGIHSTKTLSGGCINHVSKLDTTVGTFFLKWNFHCQPDLFEREAESLRELSKIDNPYLSIPQVIDYKGLNDSPAFLLLEYLEPSRSSGKKMDEMLGRGLALIHQHRADKFGFYNDNYCGSTLQDNSWNNNWIDFFGQQRLGQILKLIQQTRNIPTSDMQVYGKLLSKLPQIIPGNRKPVLIHGDLWSGNYMHTSIGPALIDPAAYYADCEMEMGIMTLFGGFSSRFWEVYLEVNPLEPDWVERNKVYQLYHILNHYYLFGGGYGQQAFGIAKYFAG